MNVFPDFGAVGAATVFGQVIGALLTFVLVFAVLLLIISAIGWGIASSHGNYRTARKARNGLLVALGAATLAGAGIAWANFLLTLGSRL